MGLITARPVESSTPLTRTLKFKSDSLNCRSDIHLKDFEIVITNKSLQTFPAAVYIIELPDGCIDGLSRRSQQNLRQDLKYCGPNLPQLTSTIIIQQ